MALQVDYLPAEDICALAEDVLAEHQPDGGIPVQVEEIIEFGLYMEIRPVRALQARFGFEGAISHDLETILVDEDVMTRFPSRYRFTLAHELGHKVLHGDYIAALSFEDKEEWKTAVTGIDPGAYGRMEHQAYIFAGCLLVPTEPLIASCEFVRSRAEGIIDLSAMGAGATSYIAGHLAKEYKVSTAVMERRIRATGVFGDSA